MDTLHILWIDLRSVHHQSSFYHYLNENWRVYRINGVEEIDQKIRETAPMLLCFEYDYPDILRLSALRQAKCLFPSTPIIMLTEQHSEALAIWALRAKVWDYFVKPFPPQELVSSIVSVLALDSWSKDEMAPLLWKTHVLSNFFPPEVRFQTYQMKKTYPAQAFVEAHYHEKIYEKEVAKICGLNVATFSRRFKKEHETTFRGYLVNFRICKARELLKNPNAMVTDIAYSVGFNDPSYFTRMFRRIVGVSPSHYHETHRMRPLYERGVREKRDKI